MFLLDFGLHYTGAHASPGERLAGLALRGRDGAAPSLKGCALCDLLRAPLLLMLYDDLLLWLGAPSSIVDTASGTALAAVGADGPARAVPAPACVLRCVEGELRGSRFRCEQSLSFGKDAGMDVVIAGDRTVSRTHATVYLRDGGFRLRDENSRNGTFLNGAKLEPRAERPLTNGDTILMGHESFEVTITHGGVAI